VQAVFDLFLEFIAPDGSLVVILQVFIALEHVELNSDLDDVFGEHLFLLVELEEELPLQVFCSVLTVAFVLSYFQGLAEGEPSLAQFFFSHLAVVLLQQPHLSVDLFDDALDLQALLRQALQEGLEFCELFDVSNPLIAEDVADLVHFGFYRLARLVHESLHSVEQVLVQLSNFLLESFPEGRALDSNGAHSEHVFEQEVLDFFLGLSQTLKLRLIVAESEISLL